MHETIAGARSARTRVRRARRAIEMATAVLIYIPVAYLADRERQEAVRRWSRSCSSRFSRWR